MLVFPPPPPGCVSTPRGILLNRKVFKEASAGSFGQGHIFYSTHILLNDEEVSSIFRAFSPMGQYIVESNRKDLRGKGWKHEWGRKGFDKTVENLTREDMHWERKGWHEGATFEPGFAEPHDPLLRTYLVWRPGILKDFCLDFLLCFEFCCTEQPALSEINRDWLSDRLTGCRGLPQPVLCVYICVRAFL